MFLKVRTGSGNKRGRPKGSGFLKKPEQKSIKQTRLSQELWDFINAQRRVNETMSDTIFRMIRQANHSRNETRKKYDALLERHNNLETYVNNLLHSQQQPQEQENIIKNEQQ